MDIQNYQKTGNNIWKIWSEVIISFKLMVINQFLVLEHLFFLMYKNSVLWCLEFKSKAFY